MRKVKKYLAYLLACTITLTSLSINSFAMDETQSILEIELEESQNISTDELESDTILTENDISELDESIPNIESVEKNEIIENFKITDEVINNPNETINNLEINEKSKEILEIENNTDSEKLLESEEDITNEINSFDEIILEDDGNIVNSLSNEIENIEEFTPFALIQGESFTIEVVKVVNGDIDERKTLTTECLQMYGHSGPIHSTNLRNLANLSGFSGYKGYNWSQYTTIPSSYTSGLCPDNNYASVHYNITGQAPYKAWETLFLFFETAKNFTLEYNANGGSNAPSAQIGTSTSDSYDFEISNAKPNRNGYTFLGWSTSSTALIPTYYGGETINVTNKTVLYAVWKENDDYGSYQIKHEYYVKDKNGNLNLENTVNEEIVNNVIVGTIIKSEEIEHITNYNNKEYSFLEDSGNVTIKKDETSNIVIKYVRDEEVDDELIYVPVDIKVRFEGLEDAELSCGSIDSCQSHPYDFMLVLIETLDLYDTSSYEHFYGKEENGTPYIVFDIGLYPGRKGQGYGLGILLSNYLPSEKNGLLNKYEYISANDIKNANNVVLDFKADDETSQTLVITLKYKKIDNSESLLKISWYDEDKSTIFESNTFIEGENEPVYSKELPTKESDENYTYKFKEWILQETPLNDDDISYVAEYEKVPIDYGSYVIKHEYYVKDKNGNMNLENTVNEEMVSNVIVGTIIKSEEIEHITSYNNKEYSFLEDSGNVTIEKDETSNIVIKYVRDEEYGSYVIKHEYYTKDKDGNLILDKTITEDEITIEAGTIIDTESIDRKPEGYIFSEVTESITIEKDIQKEIILKYVKDKEYGSYQIIHNYYVKGLDGNVILKESIREDVITNIEPDTIIGLKDADIIVSQKLKDDYQFKDASENLVMKPNETIEFVINYIREEQEVLKYGSYKVIHQYYLDDELEATVNENIVSNVLVGTSIGVKDTDIVVTLKLRNNNQDYEFDSSNNIVIKENETGTLIIKYIRHKEIVKPEPDSISITLTAKKKLENASLKDKQFSFRLTDGTVSYIADNDKDGNIKFHPLVFNSEGTYRYTITEEHNNVSNIKYDSSKYEVEITITNVNDKFISTVKYFKDGKELSAIHFINIYESPKKEDSSPKNDSSSDTSNTELITIEDIEIPKANPVETGDTSPLFILFSLFVLSVLGLIFVSRKKKP